MLIASLEQKRAQLREERKPGNMNRIDAVYFKVNKRAVRDRYNPLARELRSKLKKEEKASGIETEMRSIEGALEDVSVLFLYSCILMSLLQI